jgi:hypothetical protein
MRFVLLIAIALISIIVLSTCSYVSYSSFSFFEKKVKEVVQSVDNQFKELALSSLDFAKSAISFVLSMLWLAFAISFIMLVLESIATFALQGRRRG